jgi:6-phosphogluconolactonase
MITTNAKLNMSILAGSQALAQEMLQLFISDAQKTIDSNGRFCAAISRYTPEFLFELLGSDSRLKSLPWSQIHLFCVDECCSPSDSGNNNYILATKSLARKVDMPSENVHQICSRCGLCRQTASIYEQTIREVVGHKENGVPRFDLVLLRMGSDGHIASLFPDTYAFFESQRLVWVTHFKDTRFTRITLTHPVLYAASHIAILVSGKEKAEILRDIFTQEYNVAKYPVHALWPVLDKITWLVDQDAARFLESPNRIEMKIA